MLKSVNENVKLGKSVKISETMVGLTSETSKNSRFWIPFLPLQKGFQFVADFRPFYLKPSRVRCPFCRWAVLQKLVLQNASLAL